MGKRKLRVRYQNEYTPEGTVEHIVIGDMILCGKVTVNKTILREESDKKFFRCSDCRDNLGFISE